MNKTQGFWHYLRVERKPLFDQKNDLILKVINKIKAQNTPMKAAGKKRKKHPKIDLFFSLQNRYSIDT